MTVKLSNLQPQITCHTEDRQHASDSEVKAVRATELAQPLGVPAVLPEDRSSDPSTHVSDSQPPGEPATLLPSPPEY